MHEELFSCMFHNFPLTIPLTTKTSQDLREYILPSLNYSEKVHIDGGAKKIATSLYILQQQEKLTIVLIPIRDCQQFRFKAIYFITDLSQGFLANSATC